MTDDDVRHVEDQVRRKVDEFIKDYQAVKSDRRGSDRSTQEPLGASRGRFSLMLLPGEVEGMVRVRRFG